MAQASRKVRKVRRLKRERSIAFRLIKFVAAERDQARAYAIQLADTIKARGLKDPAPVESEPSLTITKVADEETEGVNVTETKETTAEAAATPKTESVPEAN